jgi:hypothetical protein
VQLDSGEDAPIADSCNRPRVIEGVALFIVTKRGNHWRCQVFHNTLVTHP